MKIIRIIGGATVVAAVAVLIPWGASTGAAQGQNEARPVVQFATRSDTSRPVRERPPRPPAPAVLGQIFQRPFKLLPNRQESLELDTFDGAVQGPIATTGTPSVTGDFEGVGNVNFVLPPDPTGDVGPDHYVQMTNLSFAVFNKDGTLAMGGGPFNNNDLWAGFGGPCETSNDGDPIVLYDQAADRWLMSQFALPNFPSGPFYECIAVSQTGDPTGAFHRYEFLIHQSKLNDYPKFGVWPDGYYMSINQFKCNFMRCRWGGQGVVAFERDAMLAGEPARMVYFDLQSVNSNLGGMLPADWDGPLAPPSGAPNPFAQVDDDGWGYSPDQLQIWNFTVNWSNPSASTFTHAQNLSTMPFNSNMCGYSRSCIPQPGTPVRVDAISDRLMFRLQYRNFGSHQALVTNHTVDENGNDRAGIRWYELRKTGGGWNIAQQGTYAPADSAHRWMGSIAMNSAGDIALGYSKASTSVYPSIVATGRLDGDQAGSMTQGEIVIQNGGGSQTHSASRWGDYSHMSVDPDDDCTFWYTQEYFSSTSSATWRTRIGSFKLRDCGGPVDLPPSVTVMNPEDGDTVSGTGVTIRADASDDVGITQVDFYVGGALVGSDTTDPYEFLWDSTTVADGVHMITATARDTASQSTSHSVSVTVNNAPGPPPPPPPPISLNATGYKVKGLQKADLSWSGAGSSNVDVFRNGAKIMTTANDGAYTDNIDNRGGGSYTYVICEAGTTTCSNEEIVTF